MTATTPQAAPAAAETEGARLTRATVYISLTLGAFGSTARVPHSTVDREVTVNANKTLLKVIKRILDCEELQAIYRFDIETRRTLRDESLPCPFRGGVYMIPVRSVERLWNWLENDRRPERARLVDAFLAVYPAAVAAMAEPLGALHSTLNYPDPEVVRADFTFDFQVTTFDTPTRLRDISPAIFAVERVRAEQHFQAAAQEVRLVLRQQMAELVAHMVDRLQPDEDGKRKRFHASTLEKTSGWLAAFSERNVLGDAELDALVNRSRELLSGADVEALRTDDEFRNRIAQGFAAIRGELDTMVGPVQRVILLEDPTPAPEPAPVS